MKLNRVLCLMILISSYLIPLNAQEIEVSRLVPTSGETLISKYIDIGDSNKPIGGFKYNIAEPFFGNGEDFSIYTYKNRDLTFNTGTGNAIFFPNKSHSKIGIGTTNPKQKLDIWGKDVSVQLRLQRTGSFVGYSDIGSDSLGFRIFPGGYGQGTNKAFLLNQKGYLGLGAIPSSNLHVFASANKHWAAKIENNGGAGWGLWVRAGYGGSLSQNVPVLKISGWDEKPRFVVQSNGKSIFQGRVGINVNDPEEALHLSNNSKLRIGPWEIFQEGGGKEVSYLKIDRWTTPDGKNYHKNQQLALDWAGRLYVQGLKVLKVEEFPDFVFEEGYKLRSIPALKKYIQINGRLPRFPSAKEVEKEGMDVASMYTKSLQMTEELTLYTIQQHEEISELKEENNALEDRLAKLEKQLNSVVKSLNK